MSPQKGRLWESIFVLYYSNILRIEQNHDLIFIKVIAPNRGIWSDWKQKNWENSQLNIIKTSELYIGYKLVYARIYSYTIAPAA